ncbi:MAG: hypothetical protein MR898_03600 [Prevotella sp.]|nr:hypothetical protein [Prevotella sp.]
MTRPSMICTAVHCANATCERAVRLLLWCLMSLMKGNKSASAQNLRSVAEADYMGIMC